MTFATHYPGCVNSPETTLTGDIADNAVTIPVADLGVFPDAPNLAVLGSLDDAETILYTGKSAMTGAGNLTGVTREFEGAAKAWVTGDPIARNFTNYDLTALQGDIITLRDLDALVYKGVINCSANPNYPAADAGDTYKISVAGKIGGASGKVVQVGDLVLCCVDSSATGDEAAVGANWDVVQTNIDGAVSGPATSTDGHIPLFDGTTGKLIKDSIYSLQPGDAGAFYILNGTNSFLIDDSKHLSDLVEGPATGVNNRVATFGTNEDGKHIKDSGVTLTQDVADILIISTDGEASLEIQSGEYYLDDDGSGNMLIQNATKALTVDETATLSDKANLASPTFTGDPKAPTPAVDDNDTSIATTAFIQGQKGTTNPLPDGTAAPGTSAKWSPIDHVHPIIIAGAGGTTLSLSKDNNGVERKPAFEKFDNDTLGAYTVTGAPTIASGVLTMAYGDKIIKALDANATTGIWDGVFQFGTAYVATDQYHYVYLGATSYVRVRRTAGNAIWLMLVLNGATLIASTDTTSTLADSTDARVSVSYDGTNYQMQWNGVNVGSATAGIAVTTPSLGAMDTAAGAITLVVTVNEMNYVPSVAYTEPFTADDETRYMQLSSTDLSTWAASAAGDVAVDTVNKKMTLTSADDRGIVATFRSYLFGSGEYEFAFDNNNDGGGGADTCCGRFAVQDINNYYKICVEDDAAGAELLKFYKVVAGIATQLGSTKDVSATYTRGNKTWIKVHWNAEQGQMWAYLRDDAGVYPTTPDISDAFSSQFTYGKVGVGATVTTAGAGNLNVDFYPWTIRAKLLIGETNVPATEAGFSFVTQFDTLESGRWTSLYGDATRTYGGAGELNVVGGTSVFNWQRLDLNQFSYGTFTFRFKNNTTAAEDSSSKFYFGWDGQKVVGLSNVGYNCYEITASYNNNAIYLNKMVNGASTALCSPITVTLNPSIDYTMKVVWNSTGITDIYLDSGAGYVYMGSGTVDTTYSKGYIGFCSFQSTGSNTDAEYDTLTFSGTRYYMKPMLRGAQIGEYYNGTASVAATRFVDDFNWDTSGEYTASGTTSFDTANGHVVCGASNSGIRTGTKFSDGYISETFVSAGASEQSAISFRDDMTGTFMATNSGTKYLVYVGNLATLNLYKIVSGSGVSIGSGTIAITANTPYTLSVLFVGSTIKVYFNGAQVISAIDSAITPANYAGIGIRTRSTTNVNILATSINAIDSTSTSGISAILGGVPHGARYDMQEEVYLSLANPLKYGEVALATVAKTTNFAAENWELYFANTTDSTSINMDGLTTMDAPLTSADWTNFMVRLLLRHRDLNDTIKVSARRKNYAGVAYDNQPAVFVDYLYLSPIWAV
jgi:hypothetical protein